MSIIKTFGNTKIEFQERNDNIWVKVVDVGRALDYSKPRAATNLFNKHSDELNEFSMHHRSDDTEIRYLNEQGVYLFCMLSGQPKAKEFRRWVARTLQQLRKKKDLTPSEYLLEQAKQFVELEKQGQVLTLRIDNHDRQIDKLTTILLPETKITEEQAENIREIIATIAYRYNIDNPPFGMVWGRAKNEMGFGAYREIPREKYPRIIRFLDSWLISLEQK